MLKGITKAAIDALGENFMQSGIENPVVAIITRSVVTRGNIDFAIAFYAGENVETEDIVNIDGIDIFNDPKVNADIEGKLLDVDNKGKFKLLSEDSG